MVDQFGNPPSRTPGRIIVPRGTAPKGPRVWTPKFRTLEVWDPIQRTARVEGFYRMHAVKRDGVTRARSSEWFHNLIVDTGMDQLATTFSPISHCQVGTGNTAPAVGDTSLVAEIAETSTIQSGTQTENASSPYDIRVSRTYRFGQGAAEGNLAEVGVGTATILFSRELIRDGMGSPTTFPVASDEYLDVEYEIIVYPPLVDDTDTITVTNSGSHDTTMRAAGINSGGGAWQLKSGGIFEATQADNYAVAYDGALGSVTGSPSGTSDAGASSALSYTPGNFYRDAQHSYGLNEANFGTGILSVQSRFGNSQSVSVSQRSTLRFQCEYDPVISKTSADTLTLTFRCAWARA